MDVGNRLFFMANARKGSSPWRPLQIPRPDPPQRPKPTPADVERHLAKLGVVIVREPKDTPTRD